MGLLSKFEGKMEDTVEGAADRMGAAPLSPVQIAKKAEKQMRREKMVGAGKQYAPTLYTVLVNADDDRRLLGYYPTLAGETETYLAAKAAEDAKRKEEIDTRNQGDQMVYQTERTLEELGDKVDAAEKAEVESKLNELKETLKGSDTAAIKAATEALTQVFYKLSEKMYQQANPQGGQPGANPVLFRSQSNDCSKGGDNGQQYYDADYTVVDDDKK